MMRTALFENHRAQGAKLIPFGGYEMPISYTGILREHAAVRHAAGIFDLSHMGQFELRGPQVGVWADSLTVNSVATMRPGYARYNVFTNEEGGAHDDVLFYRLDVDRWLLVVNAANVSKMARVIGQSPHQSRALIALQGPKSVEIMKCMSARDFAAMSYYSCLETTMGGAPVIVARTGYTGEDGFEIFCNAENAPDLWEALLTYGRPQGLQAAGLGARDMLRLEAGMPLYGHELSEEITPLQAGLGWAIKFSKPAFIGREALLQQSATPYDRIVGLVLESKVPARAGYPVFAGAARAGEVRSGSVAPSVGKKNIATALVAAAAAQDGTELEVEIRGDRHRATVVPLPFYRRSK